MKRVLFYSVLPLLFVLVSCSGAADNQGDENTLNEANASDLGHEFLEAMYHVDLNDSRSHLNDIDSMVEYQNEFARFFTEDEFNDLYNRRIFTIPQEAAVKQNSSIAVKDIEFELTEENEAEETMKFVHQFKLEFVDDEGKVSDELELTGQMTIIKVDDSLKISRYYDKQIPVELFSP